MDGNSDVTCKAVLMVRIANELIEQTCPKSITFAFRLYYRNSEVTTCCTVFVAVVKMVHLVDGETQRVREGLDDHACILWRADEVAWVGLRKVMA